ncbi:MAG: hypothetical protein PWQ65_761, partial [Bacteroidota bacterium]|nr:hypothetical protein [Bacteroidota bacterium]
MNLPSNIDPCPIVDALLEVRFTSIINANAVFGIIYNVLQIVSLKKEDYTPDKKSKRKLEYFRERFAIDFAYIREIINKIYDKYENVQYKITSSSHNGSRHVITVSVVKSD